MEPDKFFEVEKVSRPQKVAIWRLVLLLGFLAWLGWLLFLRLVYVQVAGPYRGYIAGVMGEKMALEFQIHQSGRDLSATGEVTRYRGTQPVIRKMVLTGAVSGKQFSLQGALSSGRLRFDGELLKGGELNGSVSFDRTGDPYDTCGFVLRPEKP